jgi:hypothetical protein
VGLGGADERWMNVMLTLLLTIHSSRVCFLGFAFWCAEAQRRKESDKKGRDEVLSERRDATLEIR